MLITLVPFFDNNMAVSAYSFFTQKSNNLLDPSTQSTGSNDGAIDIPALELLRSIGTDALTGGKEVFVPLNSINIFADIRAEYDGPADKVILLIDTNIKPEDMYIKRIGELRAMGFKVAIRKLHPQDFDSYKPILLLMDYIIIDDKKVNLQNVKIYFAKAYPGLKLIAGNLATVERYDAALAIGDYCMYEGGFFRLPINKGQHEVAPLKVNYIQLLNVVNNSNFELSDAANIIGQDTALVISLLKMVNTRAINSEITSIRHAAAMLGQKELKQWINTAVTKELYADKPNEITRVSLIRAKFAENLARHFEMAIHAQELFLMELFSVINVILDMEMEEALKVVQVSHDVHDALVKQSGKYFPIHDFILNYEAANWQEVSRLMIIHNIGLDDLHEAYVSALSWYGNLISKAN
jgi:EAL and modified HD-GYP domain-containing signal transduction protein